VGIDELHLDVVPDGVMIIFTNVDRPGIVGKVGTILGKAKINIAGLHVGRVAIGKRAVSIFSVDNDVSSALLRDLATIVELSDVKVVKV
jgi:D-3-phosphoglycerate dehydrogenase